MPPEKTPRWRLRFENYQKALANLAEVTQMVDQPAMTLLLRDALIKRYELCYELAWNLIKDYLEDQGDKDIFGSKTAIRLALDRGMIHNGEIWMKMIDDNIASNYAYDSIIADGISHRIKTEYLSQFKLLGETVQKLYDIGV